MRNKYLLLGAASAMMLAACSEDINQGPEANKPVENALNLTSLSPASQAGRVSLPGQTRGQKSDRLQLVAKIAPVAESQAAVHNWSATGIAISNGVAYVSWHSNHQATVAADAWGGAIDVLDVNALANGIDAVITNTYVSETAKFNGIVADGSTLYLPITSYARGAQVGRWTRGSLAVDTITVPGVSANSIEVDGNNLNVVTGYAGGVYSIPADFDVENPVAPTQLIAYNEAFGGKYINGGLVLRTNDEKMEILSLDGTVRNEGAPLISEEKKAEVYNPENGGWNVVEGTAATHYGKHTMAVDGNYRYVAGGQGANGQNGLRVYQGTGLAWQNGTNTTAVAVEGDYVFAATGSGLRVYEKYNGTELPLFAFEVLNYDEDGKATGAANEDGTVGKPVAGTDAHSCNFVAFDQETGLAFVACGQSGVYVFRLDTTVEVGKKLTGFITPDANLTEEVDEDADPVTKEVPAGPSATDKTFEKWVDKDGNEYQPGEKKDFNPGETIELTPVYSAIVTFEYDGTETAEKVNCGETVAATKFPSIKAPEGYDFKGWVIKGTETPFTSSTVVEKNITVVPVIVEHVYAYILHFDGNKEGITVSNLPGDIKQDEAKMTIPNMTPTVPEGTLNPAFIGWAKDPNMSVAHKDAGIWTPIMPGDNFDCTEAETTLYAIWATNATAGGNQGGNVEEEEKPETGNGGGAGNSGSEHP